MKKRKFITAVFTVLVSAMLACMPAICENAAKNTAVLILSDTREIKITAETEDGSAITVEGCTETALASSWDWVNKTVLHARGEKVVLKGKIIKLDCSGNNLTELNVQGLPLQRLWCSGNQLTELNIQGCTSLQDLDCGDNQLNKEAFTKLFKDLSDRSGKDIGKCILYTEETGEIEGNYRNFTAEELKVIKDKNWLPSYTNSSGRSVEIQ